MNLTVVFWPKVADLVHGLEKVGQSQVPILICGDLNSFPERLVFCIYIGKTLMFVAAATL